jgi:hypothetical protein
MSRLDLRALRDVARRAPRGPSEFFWTQWNNIITMPFHRGDRAVKNLLDKLPSWQARLTANLLIRRDMRSHRLLAHSPNDLRKWCSLMRVQAATLSVLVRPKCGQRGQVTKSARSSANCQGAVDSPAASSPRSQVLGVWIQTTGACQVGTSSAGSQRRLRSCMRAVVRSRCCTSCCTELTSKYYCSGHLEGPAPNDWR